MTKEQKEGVRNSQRVNRNYEKGSSEILAAWITDVKSGLGEQSELACQEMIRFAGAETWGEAEHLAASECPSFL